MPFELTVAESFEDDAVEADVERDSGHDVERAYDEAEWIVENEWPSASWEEREIAVREVAESILSRGDLQFEPDGVFMAREARHHASAVLHEVRAPFDWSTVPSPELPVLTSPALRQRLPQSRPRARAPRARPVRRRGSRRGTRACARSPGSSSDPDPEPPLDVRARCAHPAISGEFEGVGGLPIPRGAAT